MSKQDEYKLNFSAFMFEGERMFGCSRWGELRESNYLARLLDDLSDREPEFLLEEVNLAINGGAFEEYYSLDVSPISLQIVPPNIIIDRELLFPLSELKLLLEEWIAHIHRYKR